MTDKNKKAKFIPFHALNEFMRDDYRLQVVRFTLEHLPELDESYRNPIDKLTRRFVQVPGFRHSPKAPAAVKARPMAEAFEKSADLVAAVLNAWGALQADLRQKVYDLLTARGWEVLPPEADRTKLPGFISHWPKGEDFDILNEAFTQMFPGTQASTDDVSLMVVWVGARLPLFPSEEEETAGEEPGEPGA